MLSAISTNVVPDLMPLCVRVIEQLAAGIQPPRRMPLPIAKTDFPKLLCLDLNKWLDLSRAHYGRREGDRFKAALSAVREAVSAGTLVVGITTQNALETANRKDAGSRTRLAAFMVDLSQNYSVLNCIRVQRLEIASAVATGYCRQACQQALRPLVVQRGLDAALAEGHLRIETGSVQLDAIVAEAMLQPEIATRFLSTPTAPDVLAEYRSNNIAVASELDRIRRADAKLRPQGRRVYELRNLVAAGTTAAQLQTALARAGVPAELFYEWLSSDQNLIRFSQLVPSIDVLGTLMLHKDRNLHSKIDPNDGEDLFFLRVAIPYANIVVTERSWTQIARTTGVDRAYDTTVIADAGELPNVLQASGCL